MNLLKSTSQRIAIFDDDANVREGYAYVIESDEFVPVDQPGPLGTLEQFLQRELPADGAVSDHHLTPAGYAKFDGAGLVAEWYKRGFPAVLCTTYGVSSADQFRSLRRWVPVVLSPDELSAESVQQGLLLARAEMAGSFIPSRKPRRALVEFVDYVKENRSVYVKLAGWGVEAVSLRVADLPAELATVVMRKPGFFGYAQVNLGSETSSELYLSEWEFDT